MFKVNNKDTKTKPMASFWCLCFFDEHAIAGWHISHGLIVEF